MKRPNGREITTGNGILAALKLRIALSTDALCEWAGKESGLTEDQFVSDWWKRLVYRVAVKLEKRGLLASAKCYNGKNYERVWRRN
jgi:hypothetical protein